MSNSRQILIVVQNALFYNEVAKIIEALFEAAFVHLNIEPCLSQSFFPISVCFLVHVFVSVYRIIHNWNYFHHCANHMLRGGGGNGRCMLLHMINNMIFNAFSFFKASF